MINSLNNIAYRILEQIRPHITDDENITLRLVKEEIAVQRALWLAQEYNKANRKPSEAEIQTLSCIDFEAVDPEDCCLTGCKVVRTTVDIPTPITSKQGLTIMGVYSIYPFEKAFDFISYERAIFSGNSRFTPNNIYSFYYNNKIYLRSKEDFILNITKGTIRGVFENPADASDIVSCDQTACYTDNMIYPITRKCEAHITKLCIENLLPKLNSDLKNDSKSDN